MPRPPIPATTGNPRGAAFVVKSSLCGTRGEAKAGQKGEVATMNSTSLPTSVSTLWTVMAVVVAGAAAADTAQARGPSFDGAWAVTITTERGDCDSGSGFGVEVRNGGVYGHGGVSVDGHVAPSGAVTVHIASGNASANGSGRL
jgi:hypothetical protein